jgi:tetratricopeptide (TPR) repeat protein
MNFTNQPKFAISFLTALIVIFGSQSTYGKSSLLDPGTLQSVQIKSGTTIEKYSDGLTVEIGKDGCIKDESSIDHYEMTATPPEAYGQEKDNGMVDNFISQMLDFAWMHDGQVPNGSRQQSRLRQFSEYYLNMREPQKAEPLARRYLQTQKVLKVTGEPLAFAMQLLGRAELSLNDFKQAVPLLEDASAFYKQDPDQFRYCELLIDLSKALLQTGKVDEALQRLDTCRKLIQDHSFNSLTAKANSSYKAASLALKSKQSQ